MDVVHKIPTIPSTWRVSLFSWVMPCGTDLLLPKTHCSYLLAVILWKLKTHAYYYYDWEKLGHNIETAQCEKPGLYCHDTKSNQDIMSASWEHKFRGDFLVFVSFSLALFMIFPYKFWFLCALACVYLSLALWFSISCFLSLDPSFLFSKMGSLSQIMLVLLFNK